MPADVQCGYDVEERSMLGNKLEDRLWREDILVGHKYSVYLHRSSEKLWLGDNQ
jgi:hypothetical protein